MLDFQVWQEKCKLSKKKKNAGSVWKKKPLCDFFGFFIKGPGTKASISPVSDYWKN